MPLLLALLALQGLDQKPARPIAFPELVPHLQDLALLGLLLHDLRSLLLEVRGELVQHSLHELATQQSLSAPASAQRNFLQSQRVQSNVIDGEVHVLVLLFLIEEVLVQSLHEDIQGLVRELSACDEVLSFFDAGFSDGRVGLDIDEGEIRFKCLVEPFPSDCDADEVVAVAPGAVGGDINGADFSVFGADYLHFDGPVDVLLHDLEGRQLAVHFARRASQLIQYFRGRSLPLRRDDFDDKVEKGVDLALERTVVLYLYDPVALALLQRLVLRVAVAHQ